MGRAKPNRDSSTRVPVEIDTAALRREFRKLRAARKLSQADVAALLGISQAAVSDFERGKFASVRPRTLLAIRSLLSTWPQKKGARQSKSSLRRIVLVEPQGESVNACLWCGSVLPALERPVRFCPLCGGRQVVLAREEAATYVSARCCATCGRPSGSQVAGEVDPASC
jgi:transcriptional regulator with XRE-family HTH domain